MPEPVNRCVSGYLDCASEKRQLLPQIINVPPIYVPTQIIPIPPRLQPMAIRTDRLVIRAHIVVPVAVNVVNIKLAWVHRYKPANRAAPLLTGPTCDGGDNHDSDGATGHDPPEISQPPCYHTQRTKDATFQAAQLWRVSADIATAMGGSTGLAPRSCGSIAALHFA